MRYNVRVLLALTTLAVGGLTPALADDRKPITPVEAIRRVNETVTVDNTVYCRPCAEPYWAPCRICGDEGVVDCRLAQCPHRFSEAERAESDAILAQLQRALAATRGNA